MPVSTHIWTQALVASTIVSVYTFLLFRNKQKRFHILLENTGPKQWILAIYMVFGLGLVTTGVYLVPWVPDHKYSPAFQSGLEAFVFALSWSMLFVLAVISYAFFTGSRYPELYLTGFLIFMGAFTLAFYPLFHSDFGSQFIHGLVVAGIMGILTIDRLAFGRYIRQSLWMLSHIVLIASVLWSLLTGAAAYFRFEPEPAKAVLYTGFLQLGAVWFYMEGIVACGRKRKDQPGGPIELPVPSRNEERSAASAVSRDAASAGISTRPAPVSLDEHSPRAPASPVGAIQTTHDQIPLLRIYCLGPFQLFVGESEIKPNELNAKPKPVEIIRILAVSPRGEASKTRLMEFVLNEGATNPTESLRGNFRRLQDLLDGKGPRNNRPPYVLDHKSHYALHPHHTWTDISEFRQLVAKGRRFLEEGSTDQALAALKAASELWRGMLLEDHDSTPWLESPRHEMKELYTHFHLDTAKALVRKNDLTAAEQWMKQAITVDPDSEEAVKILVLVQHAQGRLKEAHASLESYIGGLKAVDVPPGPMIVRLRNAIRKNERINPVGWI